MANVDEIISKFLKSKSFPEIETLADKLGDLGDKEAVEPLVSRLGDYFTEKDGDIEDAICSSLVKLGVMEKTGINLMFEFLEDDLLSNEVLEIIRRYKDSIPKKYFKESLDSRNNVTNMNSAHDAKEVIIEIIAKTRPLTIIYTCPYCCSGDEGIRSQIPFDIEKEFLESLKENQGCQTPCPNCGKTLLLKADISTLKSLEDF